MELFDRIVIPEYAMYLLGVLGLLVLWQYYRIQVLNGRIYAVDFWDVSGIRMLMHVTTKDGRTCEVCREANGQVFLPSLATKKNFNTLRAQCVHKDGCRCLYVGLYGGWPEANHIIQHLRKRSRKKVLQLSDTELRKLFQGPWERGVSASTDRLTVYMVEALQIEERDPEAAIARYRDVVGQARGARDLRLVVPAYLRLAETLERLNRPEQALEVIAQFDQRFSRRRSLFYYPSEEHRGLMSLRKTRLKRCLRTNKISPEALPAEIEL